MQVVGSLLTEAVTVCWMQLSGYVFYRPATICLSDCRQLAREKAVCSMKLEASRQYANAQAADSSLHAACR